MKVAILVPVLSRPHRIATLMANVASSTKDYRLLFIANESDHEEIVALDGCRADYIVVPDKRMSWACKINDGFNATTEPWIFTGADDLFFRPDWFERALAWATDTTCVIGTNDIANGRVMMGQHSTHTLFRRDYINAYGTIDQPGLVMHEGYRHDFTDDEAIATAVARGVYTHAYDAIVEHLHPMVGKSPDDATYRLGKKYSSEGRRLFHQRKVLWADARKVQMSMVPAPDRAVVVTATYGNYDSNLRPPVPQNMPVDWLCFTDQPDLQVPAPWQIVVRPPVFPDNSRLSAKVPKMLPDVGCDDVVWMDASHEITSPSFVREALAARHDGIAAFIHPRRNCIYAETDALLGAENQGGLYFSRPLREQEAAYRQEGHPDNAGLFACGVLAWDLRDPRAKQLGEAWLAETEKWSHQDQVEFPVVCRRLGITPGTFPIGQIDQRLSRGHPYLANQWFRIHRHAINKPASPVSVLIPFSSDEPRRVANFEFVKSIYLERGWEVIVGDCPGEWSKGRALADAFSRASHDVLVIADADCYLEDQVMDAALQTIAGGAAWVVPHTQTWRLDQISTAKILSGNRMPRGPIRPATIGGGMVVLTRQAWEHSGGIDPRFFGWGGEDISFGWALETLCGPLVQNRGKLMHLWHSPITPKRGSLDSEALAGRYRRARGDVEAMTALVREVRDVRPVMS